MDYKSILKDINNKKLKNVYLLIGKEGFLRDYIIKEIRKNYIDENFETLNYIHFDGKETDVETIINACETLPFMAEKKIVIVEDSPYLSSGKGANNEENLIDYILNLSHHTTLIFVVNEEKVDSRKKIIKNIKKVGDIVEINKIKGNDLDKWILKAFKKYKKNISQNEVRYFIDVTGYSESNSNKTLYDIQNEILKLCNYLGHRDNVSKEDIDKVLAKSLQNNIFKLLDGMGKKSPSSSLSFFNEMLLDNEPPQRILFMIIKQIRLLYMAKLLVEKGYSQGVVVSKLGVHPYAAQKVINQSKNFSNDELQKILEKSLETDRDIKRGKVGIKLAIERLIIESAH